MQLLTLGFERQVSPLFWEIRLRAFRVEGLMRFQWHTF